MGETALDVVTNCLVYILENGASTTCVDGVGLKFEVGSDTHVRLPGANIIYVRLLDVRYLCICRRRAPSWYSSLLCVHSVSDIYVRLPSVRH